VVERRICDFSFDNLDNTEDSRVRKIITFNVLSVFVFILLLTSGCSASRFSKEKEVKDEYLQKLFTPNIPYGSVKVVEDNIGRRFIVIRTKEKINNRMLNEYSDLLLSRGVNIYGTYYYGVFSWQKTVTDFAITITRKVKGEPDTIEISESVVKDPIKKEPIAAASAKGKEIRIAIESDFGKTWKKIKIISDKEPAVPEPKIGRYPGAKLREAHTWSANQGGGRLLVYVSKSSFKDIAYFYDKGVKEMYVDVFTPFTIYSAKGREKEREEIEGTKKAMEQIENPKLYAHPLKVFGIKTISQRFDINGRRSTPSKFDSTEVILKRSIDPNLINYIEIEIKEN
jgi:hypothetical protein